MHEWKITCSTPCSERPWTTLFHKDEQLAKFQVSRGTSMPEGLRKTKEGLSGIFLISQAVLASPQHCARAKHIARNHLCPGQFPTHTCPSHVNEPCFLLGKTAWKG